MELKDLGITKAKLGVMLMAVIVIIAASQLSPMFLSAGENSPQKDIKTTGTNSLRELSFDEEFTIKDPLLEAGRRFTHLRKRQRVHYRGSKGRALAGR
jgi:hypothetical protein